MPQRTSGYGNIYDGNAVRKISEVPERERRHAQSHRRSNKILRIRERELRRARRSGINFSKAIVTVSLVVISFFLVFGLIYGKVQLMEISYDITGARQQLSELQSVEIQLKMEATANSTGTELEDYAKNVLGMTKVKSDQVVYVNMNSGDTGVIEDGHSGTGFFGKLWNTICSWFE
ncbi:MAG: hypothetical protein Q4C42_04790 [Clostridia bacterium]|nr:hypothetical protein [Clostridia bacterium]